MVIILIALKSASDTIKVFIFPMYNFIKIHDSILKISTLMTYFRIKYKIKLNDNHIPYNESQGYYKQCIIANP